MEKALAILEQHVQWLALGLGVLFLALMVNSYVLQDPVTVQLGGQTVKPGEIDKLIAESREAKALKGAVSSNAVLADKDLPTLPSAKDVISKMVVAVEPFVPGRIEKIIDDPGTKEPTYSMFAIANPPTYIDSMFGRAVLAWQKLPPAPPAAVPGAVAVVPAAVPAVVVAPAQPQNIVVDVDYSSHLWKIKLEDWTKAMEAAGITRTDKYSTCDRLQIIAVVLQREEKLPTGQWSGRVETVAPPAFLDNFKVFDPTDKDPISYLEWAAANVRLIVQPPFPPPVSGQPWAEPGQPLPAKILGPDQGVPMQPPPVMPIPGVVAPAPVAPRGAAFGEGGGIGRAAPPIGTGPNPYQPGGVAVPYAPPVAVAPGGVSGDGSAGQPGRIPGEGGLPEQHGMFNPFLEMDAAVTAGLPGEVKVYTHDTTCLANKTYRYRMMYYVRNPFFKASGKIQGPIAQAFAVASPVSAWSKDVVIPPRVEIFAIDIKPVDQKNPTDYAWFDVFVSRDGGWPKEVCRVMPGDPIAGIGADKKEWNSGWTLVDVRKNPKTNKAYLIIADSNGKLERRDAETDANNPLRLMRNAVPGVAPGTAPPIGPAVAPPTGIGPTPPAVRPPPRGIVPGA
jgi:hypothetical protein